MILCNLVMVPIWMCLSAAEAAGDTVIYLWESFLENFLQIVFVTALELFQWLVNGIMDVCFTFLAGVILAMKGLLYYFPSMTMLSLSIRCSIYVNKVISSGTGVFTLDKTRIFFLSIDTYFVGDGKFVHFIQALAIISDNAWSIPSLSDITLIVKPITSFGLFFQWLTAAIQSNNLEVMKGHIWENTVKWVVGKFISTNDGRLFNAIFASAIVAYGVYIHRKDVRKYYGAVLSFYIIFFCWCMCIRCAEFGLWKGLVDVNLTSSYAVGFAYVLWKLRGPITKKFIGCRTRDVVLPPGVGPSSPTPSALSRGNTPPTFQLLRPSHCHHAY
jgi:hypothetical protein